MAAILKKILSYLKSVMSNYSKFKVSYKTHKTLKLRLKLPYLGIFNQECEKNIVIFHASTLEFFKIQSFVQSKKPHTWDQKGLIWIILGRNLKAL